MRLILPDTENRMPAPERNATHHKTLHANFRLPPILHQTTPVLRSHRGDLESLHRSKSQAEEPAKQGMCPGPKKSQVGREKRVLGGGSVGKMLAGHTWDQSVEPQCPNQKAGMVVCICDPSAEDRQEPV